VDRLKEKYQKEVAPALTEKFGYKNVMQLPKVEKIIINMGVGEAVGNPKALDAAVTDLTAIAGQKPQLTRAKKSLAAWKLREGMPIGCKVTLRGTRMYQFLDKFMNVALPRVRDFRGVSEKAFDGRGNYAVGLREQLIFPEKNKTSAPFSRISPELIELSRKAGLYAVFPKRYSQCPLMALMMGDFEKLKFRR